MTVISCQMFCATVIVIFISNLLNVSSDTALESPTCIPDTVHRDSWLKEEYPNPRHDIGRCGRNCKQSWICDPGHIISEAGADELDSIINTVATSDKCDCSACSFPDGYNISVALVPAMNRNPGDDAVTEARKFAIHLRRSWNYQKCDNDILIFVSRDDKQIYTTAGEKANQVLTLDCIEEVYNNVKSQFTNGYYFQGLKDTISHYKRILETGNCVHIRTLSNHNTIGMIVGILFGGFFVMCIIVFVCIRRRFSGGCHDGSPGINRNNHTHSWFIGESAEEEL